MIYFPKENPREFLFLKTREALQRALARYAGYQMQAGEEAAPECFS